MHRRPATIKRTVTVTLDSDFRLRPNEYLAVRYVKEGAQAGTGYAELVVKDNRLVLVCDEPVDVYGFDEWVGADGED